jgi:hypothetical protein
MVAALLLTGLTCLVNRQAAAEYRNYAVGWRDSERRYRRGSKEN